MSQHILKTTMSKRQKVIVTMGYDRPLDYVFCTVMNKDGDVIYSNLDDDRAGTDLQDIEYFRPILGQLGIKVPEEMLTGVKSDQLFHVGNRVVYHSAEKRMSWIRRLIERLAATITETNSKIPRREGIDSRSEKEPEYLDLLAVIGDNAGKDPNYCSRSYWKWERDTAKPLLEKLGYSNVEFSMGECETFGPLTRTVTATKDGMTHRFIYG
jgi:hypothetical protein